MPVRKIPKNYLHVTGSFASRKNGRMIGYESPLEHDFYICLEYDPTVVSFEEQPVEVPFQGQRRGTRGYVPDVLVSYQDPASGILKPRILYEVKHTSDLERNQAKYAPKFEGARIFAADRGWTFQIVTQEQIRTPRLANLKFLREFHEIVPLRESVDAVLELFASIGPVSFSEALARVARTDTEALEQIPVIWHMVATGDLSADLDQPLSSDTVLSPSFA